MDETGLEKTPYREIDSHPQSVGVVKAKINGKPMLAFIDRVPGKKETKWSLSWERSPNSQAYQRKNVGQLEAASTADVEIFGPTAEPVRPVDLEDRNSGAVYLVDSRKRALPISENGALKAIADAKPIKNISNSEASWATVIPDIDQTGKSYITVFAPQEGTSGDGIFRAFSKEVIKLYLEADEMAESASQKKYFGLAQQVKAGNTLKAYADLGRTAIAGMVKNVPSTRESILDWVDTVDITVLQKLAAMMVGENLPIEKDSTKSPETSDLSEFEWDEKTQDRKINEKAVAIGTAIGIGAGVLGMKLLEQSYPSFQSEELYWYFNYIFKHEAFGLYVLGGAAGAIPGLITSISVPYQKAVERVRRKLSGSNDSKALPKGT